jgi:hypothetical protein
MRALQVVALARASLRPRKDVVRHVVGQAGTSAELAGVLLGQDALTVAFVLGAEAALLTGAAAVVVGRARVIRAGLEVRAGRIVADRAGGHQIGPTLRT